MDDKKELGMRRQGRAFQQEKQPMHKAKGEKKHAMLQVRKGMVSHRSVA